MSENKAVDPYEKPEGYIPPDPKTGKGMWIFAAFLAALAIGGYLFYQAGSNDIEQARRLRRRVHDLRRCRFSCIGLGAHLCLGLW